MGKIIFIRGPAHVFFGPKYISKIGKIWIKNIRKKISPIYLSENMAMEQGGKYGYLMNHDITCYILRHVFIPITES